MSRTTFWMVFFFAMAMLHPAAALAGKTLTASIPAHGLASLELDSAVGDVSISPSPDGSVHVTVGLTPRRAGFFSSSAKGKRQVAAARLGVERHGPTLQLKITGFHDEPRFETTWRITVPAGLALTVDMGVGDLEIRGITGSITADVGVGDTSIEGDGKDLSVHAGVGDITVRAGAGAYGRVECSTGVGSASLTVSGKRHEGDGMISKNIIWKGHGNHTMNLETGVGSIEVTLATPPESAGS